MKPEEWILGKQLSDRLSGPITKTQSVAGLDAIIVFDASNNWDFIERAEIAHLMKQEIINEIYNAVLSSDHNN